jgi:adenosylhomocysteine nucleosidase
MTRVAIIAAMAQELKPLVRGWRRESRNGVTLWSQRRGEGVRIAACAGSGAEAATRAFVEIERDGPIDAVLSTGWAGALGEGFAVGRAYGVSEVTDARTGERFRAIGGSPECGLVTSPRFADQAEKRRLAATHGAALVDMEAAAVARLAGRRGVPFYCVKGVSDGLQDQLPDFNRFLSAEGRFRRARFVLFAALRPWLWPALVRLGENSGKAARCMRDCLLDILDE